MDKQTTERLWGLGLLIISLVIYFNVDSVVNAVFKTVEKLRLGYLLRLLYYSLLTALVMALAMGLIGVADEIVTWFIQLPIFVKMLTFLFGGYCWQRYCPLHK